MTSARAARGPEPDDRRRLGPRGELRLDPRVHGPARVPGLRTTVFDLTAFAAALEDHDVAAQLAQYAPAADIRIVELDGRGPSVRDVRGSLAIWSWLTEVVTRHVEVTHLVDGGDRIAFIARWRDHEGRTVVATSTAELADGLISTQHTLLGRPRGAAEPVDGWTRVGRDLWSTSG